MVTPAQGSERIEKFLAQVTDPEVVGAEFARQMLETAMRSAQSASSPQAPMASTGLELAGAQIRGPAGALVSSSTGSVELGRILFGSEFGSDLYTQFGPRVERGQWLFPAADEPAVIAAVERETVDRLITEAVK